MLGALNQATLLQELVLLLKVGTPKNWVGNQIGEKKAERTFKRQANAPVKLILESKTNLQI